MSYTVNGNTVSVSIPKTGEYNICFYLSEGPIQFQYAPTSLEWEMKEDSKAIFTGDNFFGPATGEYNRIISKVVGNWSN